MPDVAGPAGPDREKGDHVHVGRREAAEQLTARVADVKWQVHLDPEVALALFEQIPLVGPQEVARRVPPTYEPSGLRSCPGAQGRALRRGRSGRVVVVRHQSSVIAGITSVPSISSW